MVVMLEFAALSPLTTSQAKLQFKPQRILPSSLSLLSTVTYAPPLNWVVCYHEDVSQSSFLILIAFNKLKIQIVNHF